MIPAARLSAAIDILAELESSKRPVVEVMRDWGHKHRFAGAKDRHTIANHVYDSLRHRASSAYRMQDESPRALVLDMLYRFAQLDVSALRALFSGEGHAPAPLSEAEWGALENGRLDDAPQWVRADVPDWLLPFMQRAFGDRVEIEGQALAERAPLDIRVNVLKSDRERQMRDLAHLNPVASALSPWGIRLPLTAQGRSPNLAGEVSFIKGRVEIQDEGSQLVSLLSLAKAGEQVLDLCAGGGGKSLALAAMMGNRGQIYAADIDGRRLAPAFERFERAGVRNVQIRMPKERKPSIEDLLERCDLVMVDAPCSGSGTWRRHPDAKWRMRPGALEERKTLQSDLLVEAARYVRPGGRLAYISCSWLVEENEDQIARFLAAESRFHVIPTDEILQASRLEMLQPFASPHGPGFRLSPASGGTDGFFTCLLQRQA